MEAGAPIRVVWGTGVGPTATAAYDTALEAAGVHNYNLITVSSVIPRQGHVEPTGTAPELGAIGDGLYVVQARSTVSGPGQATAGLGWAVGDGPGIFYEAEGEFDADEAAVIIEQGLDAGQELRDWSISEMDHQIVSVRADADYATAVVLAVYGDGKSLLA